MTNKEKQKEQIIELMNLHFGFSGFRKGQEEVIDAVLSGNSTIAVMPTGGGKSLCFQLPALVFDGVTIVISPLISLMKDQVDGLQKMGIPATYINSAISAEQVAIRLREVRHGYYKLLYIAPERFYSNDFMNMLKNIKVELLAVDEAHCISQWGHDFRPSYLYLSKVREVLNNPVVLALTATATPQVREDIARQLKLDKPVKIITGFARPNLQFGVMEAKEFAKERIVLEAVLSQRDEAGIIYAGTRARADAILEHLLANDIEAASYHAGLSAEERKWIQESFMSGCIDVIVATNAFGLGIDKPNIRYVIHYDMPGTLEAYYQEAGRAGRDGKPSVCLLLYNSRDRRLQEFFIKGDNPPPKLIIEIYELLLSYEKDSVFITYADIGSQLSETVPDMAIGTALKILEKEGYLRRSREANRSAFIKTTSSLSHLREAVGARAKKQLEILNLLFAKYEKEIKSGWQVNIEEVSDILDIKKETLMRLVRSLAEKNLMEYKPPFKGTEIKILKKTDPQKLNLDFKALKEKLQNAYDKLDKIEEYVYTQTCRQKFILDYFGDMDARVCGQCDICLNGKSVLRREKEKQKIKNSQRFYCNVRPQNDIVFKPPEKKPTLNTKLTQLETLELFNQGLEIRSIAQQRGLTSRQVVDHLCFLIEKGLIKNINRLVDKKQEKEILRVIKNKKIQANSIEDIYIVLKEKFDYDKLRIVLAKQKTKKTSSC